MMVMKIFLGWGHFGPQAFLSRMLVKKSLAFPKIYGKLIYSCREYI
jgi:hypothetical protein